MLIFIADSEIDIMLSAMVSSIEAGREHTNVVRQIGAQIIEEMAKQTKTVEEGFDKLCAILAKKNESA